MRFGRGIPLYVLAIHFLAQTGFAKADAVYPVSPITCTDGATETVSMRSTDRLPEASGTARVERKGGTTEIQLELDSMRPAALFGGDYNTYVLWVVPPGRAAENLGDIPLDGDRARLRVSTSSAVFAILVSAEPHYLVSAPSVFVVLENKPDPRARMIGQPVIEGTYNFVRSTLSGVKGAEGEVHTDVKQAFTAVRLAQRAGAATLASDELAQARHALDETFNLWHERQNRTEIAAKARQTIRLAVAAQRLAQGRALRWTLGEREGSGGGTARAKGAIRGASAVIGGKDK